VISRNIEVGQTVAASFQTPTLFLIATDLTKMQIDTNVSESDIGEAREGQAATFSVEAYPGRTFKGKVRQVRRAPISVQNVVTYNVVIDVDNADLALLPGLTANVRIITAEARDVLTVPAPALRFAPTRARQDDGRKSGARKDAASETPRVWVLRDGRPHPVAVTPGVASTTQVAVEGEIAEGDQVITGEVVAKGAAKTSTFRPPMPPRF
jgi:HlyD family secretion protein